MQDLGMNLWRIAKEFNGSGAADLLKLAASVLIVVAASWKVAGTAWSTTRAAAERSSVMRLWEWLKGAVGSKASIALQQANEELALELDCILRDARQLRLEADLAMGERNSASAELLKVQQEFCWLQEESRKRQEAAEQQLSTLRYERDEAARAEKLVRAENVGLKDKLATSQRVRDELSAENAAMQDRLSLARIERDILKGWLMGFVQSAEAAQQHLDALGSDQGGK